MSETMSLILVAVISLGLTWLAWAWDSKQRKKWGGYNGKYNAEYCLYRYSDALRELENIGNNSPVLAARASTYAARVASAESGPSRNWVVFYQSTFAGATEDYEREVRSLQIYIDAIEELLRKNA